MKMTSLLDSFEDCAGNMIEKEVGVKVILIDPDGKEYTKSALDPDKDLKGWFVQESLTYDFQTGVDVVSDKPVLSLRLRSLERVPKSGENWTIRVATKPDNDELKSFILAGAPKNRKTVGFINLGLGSVSQI
jgi:hypothetical protein